MSGAGEPVDEPGQFLGLVATGDDPAQKVDDGLTFGGGHKYPLPFQLSPSQPCE